MTLPNKLTVLRLILSPIFFVVYFLPDWTGGGGGISAAAVLLIFVVIEVSDVLDGYFARRLGLVSDIGKVIDPFADVMSRMTYFFCFTLAGLMPAWIFLLLIYRELGATFLRMLLIRRGIALAGHRRSRPLGQLRGCRLRRPRSSHSMLTPALVQYR